MHSPRNRATGFTLIELLVALTILASLMVVVYAGLSVALTMWQNAGRRAEAFEETQISVEILRGQVRGALPLFFQAQPEQTPPPRPKIAFEGTERGLRFVSSVSWRDGSNAVPRWIQWIAEEGRVSVTERRILSPWNTPNQQADWVSDLSFLQNAGFRFLRRATTDRPQQWLTSWDSAVQPELPAAVEIHYVYRGEPAVLTVPLDYADANWKGYQLE